MNAQSQGITLNLRYTNAGYMGLEYSYRTNPRYGKEFSFGIGTYYGSSRFIPETHISYSQMFLLGEFSVTSDNISPSIGVNLLNLVKVRLGYSWKIGHEDRGMKDPTFGLNFLLGSKGFYDPLF